MQFLDYSSTFNTIQAYYEASGSGHQWQADQRWCAQHQCPPGLCAQPPAVSIETAALLSVLVWGSLLPTPEYSPTILSGCITTWYRNRNALDCKALCQISSKYYQVWTDSHPGPDSAAGGMPSGSSLIPPALYTQEVFTCWNTGQCAHNSLYIHNTVHMYTPSPCIRTSYLASVFFVFTLSFYIVYFIVSSYFIHVSVIS